MTSRLDKTIKRLRDNGDLSDGELVAIYGAVTLLAEIDSQEDQNETEEAILYEFKRRFGQFALRGLHKLKLVE